VTTPRTSVPARLLGRPAVVAVALVLLAAAVAVLFPGSEGKTLTAHFSRTVSLFVGSEVRILGVPVGEVTSVVPEGNSVRVEMVYDEEYDVPAEAQAVIVTPTLVADRFVQLTPAYTGGEKMSDGAEIPLERTAVPVELDRIYQSLDELSTALGPNGVNADGSLDTLLAAGTKTLKGKGARGNAMVRDLSAAVDTFGKGSGDLFATVRQLQAFVDALARNDRFVSAFMTDLTGVSGELSGEREELRAALANLAEAVGEVDRFVRDNKGLVEEDVAALTDVTRSIVKEKDSLATALEKGPVGAGNLAIAFDSSTHAIGARIQTGPNVDDVDGFLCAIVQNSDIPSKNQACELFSRIFEPLPSSDPNADRRTSVRPVSGRVSERYLRLRQGPATTLRQLLGAGA
jgi:phospholipid/cholesterol/gamma-HCH transport system substrate-binding protein